MKKFNLKSWLVSVVALATTATPALAAGNLTDVYNPVQQFGSLAAVIQKALPLVFTLTAFLAIGVFMLGAVKYIVSRGDSKATEGARSTMTGAVVGLVIVLGTVAISSILSATLGLGLFGSPAVTQGPTNGSFDLSCAFRLSKSGDCIGLAYGDLGSLTTVVLLLLTAIGAIAFFLMLLWNGLRYMTARGDDKALSDAKGGLTSALIGLLLLISSFAIIRLLATTVFGFDSF